MEVWSCYVKIHWDRESWIQVESLDFAEHCLKHMGHSLESGYMFIFMRFLNAPEPDDILSNKIKIQVALNSTKQMRN